VTTLLDASAYPAIRAALDVTLDSAVLPDATIALPLYLGLADLEVKRRDPDWATRAGDALQHLENAAVLLTAAYLAPAIPALTREKFPDYEYWGPRPPVTEQAKDLRARALAELAQTTGVALLPAGKFFTIARGTRVSDGR
jgi:hypothetical protein